MNEPTDTDTETLRALQFALNPLQIEDRKIPNLGELSKTEMDVIIKSCIRDVYAREFDEKAEHENDLRYESRVDAESWQYDGPAEMEDV